MIVYDILENKDGSATVVVDMTNKEVTMIVQYGLLQLFTNIAKEALENASNVPSAE